MNRFRCIASALLLCCPLLLGIGQLAAAEKVVAVNEYFGVAYEHEPVSFDWDLPQAVPLERIGVKEVPSQVEILAGDATAVSKARIWITVSFPHIEREVTDQKGNKKTVRTHDTGAKRHKRFTLTDSLDPRKTDTAISVGQAAAIGGVGMALWDNGLVRVLVPVEGASYPTTASALTMPGPVVSIGREDEALVGRGYLDTIERVSQITVATSIGPIYNESRISYEFAGGKRYAASVRLYAHKPYIRLVEDFDLGGNARFMFNYEDWPVDAFFRTGDANRYQWKSPREGNPTGEFVQIHGQRPLARLVVWTQFNYFGGKQETIGLKGPDTEALKIAHQENLGKWEKAVAKWEANQEKWKTKPPKNGIPPKPPEPAEPVYATEPLTLAGASMPIGNVVTPGGDATIVGAFYIRPDRWTHAKLNHVDLYLRPELPGDALTRGIVGLEGAVLRPAMEAWLVEGHREWALFAVPSGNKNWLTRAHIREGVWNLDRLNRLPLVWNSDGSPVAPADTQPGDQAVGGAIGSILNGMGGRHGLQYFNGSNPHIRGTQPPWEGWDGTVKETTAAAGKNNGMVAMAIDAYVSADDATYPSRRAMLPWTDPEALNPFYQGMENMNFNADLYRWVLNAGVKLKRHGHPDAQRFIDHASDSFDMALDAYVYPQSGCWEESHGYAGHTIKTVTPLAYCLKRSGWRNFFDDPRWARMIDFFTKVYSPVDPNLGGRVVPPVGDHGLSTASPNKRLGKLLKPFAETGNDEVKTIAGQMAHLVAESWGTPPEGIATSKPDMRSTWLQGYGSVLRSVSPDHEVLQIRIPEAVLNKDRKKTRKVDAFITIPRHKGAWLSAGSITAPDMKGFASRASYTVSEQDGRLTVSGEVTFEPTGRKRTPGGVGRYDLELDLATMTGTCKGVYTSAIDGLEPVSLETTIAGKLLNGESFVVVRAGQSWGHHHSDKGSLWCWMRNVAFFGDSCWGAPPGGTYWNPFKQGPQSGTQIDFVGINNWTLPCKYPAPWIADDEYGQGFDYVLARCLYPYNPKLDLSKSSPVALSQGYDRQVLFVHPDVLVVRDNIDTTCPTVWRLHSYQGAGTTISGSTATLASPQEVTGNLSILSPAGAVFSRVDAFPDIHPFTGKTSDYAGAAFSTPIIRWNMPANTSATWAFAVNGKDEAKPLMESLDDQGRVSKLTLHDGTIIHAFLNGEEFDWTGAGFVFQGTVGLAVTKDGTTSLHPIRAKQLKKE